MTSAIKSWIYQDLISKPSECLLYRKVQEGGLSLYHISCRAKANLIKSFIETACGNDFKVNDYHRALFVYYFLENAESDPERPPYYSKDLFKIIKEAQQSNLEIKSMSLKE